MIWAILGFGHIKNEDTILEYGSDRHFDPFIRSWIPILHHFYYRHQKRGKVSPKNLIFHTFCIFRSNEHKKPLLMSYDSIPTVLRHWVSDCMIKMTLTKWNSGYTDLKRLKSDPKKSGIIHGKKFSDFNFFPNCLKIWSNVTQGLANNWSTFGELLMEAVGAEFFFVELFLIFGQKLAIFS